MDAAVPLYERYKDLTVMDAHYHGTAVFIPDSSRVGVVGQTHEPPACDGQAARAFCGGPDKPQGDHANHH